MIFDVSHRTSYRYTQAVVQSQHLVHLTPRYDGRQKTLRTSMMIEPAPAMRFEGQDVFGNPVTILDIEEPHKEFVLHARSTIETYEPAVCDFAQTTPWDRLDEALYQPGRDYNLDVIRFRCPSRLTPVLPNIRDYAAASFLPGRPVLEAANDLTLRIYRDFKFDPSATGVSTPIEDVFRKRRGVCQDFAHLALAFLRSYRVPARYMSGYILTHPVPGQPRLRGADASHAWISVWSPETGWREFDPTNGLAQTSDHILLAHGRDYHDVCPIGGVILGGGDQTISVGVDVTRMSEFIADSN